MRRGVLHTTTVRFTADQWATIKTECERLGIAKSAYIREAVILCFGHRQAEDRVRRLEKRHDELARRVEWLAHARERVASHARGVQ